MNQAYYFKDNLRRKQALDKRETPVYKDEARLEIWGKQVLEDKARLERWEKQLLEYEVQIERCGEHISDEYARLEGWEVHLCEEASRLERWYNDIRQNESLLLEKIRKFRQRKKEKKRDATQGISLDKDYSRFGDCSPTLSEGQSPDVVDSHLNDKISSSEHHSTQPGIHEILSYDSPELQLN